MLTGGLGFIGRQYRHISRYRRIALVLLEHGFGDLVTTVGLDRRLRLGRFSADRKEGIRAARLTRWERIRMVLEKLGPSFVKLGQMAGTRPDMVPQELCTELERLQDTVSPFRFVEAKGTVEAELGDSLKCPV